MTEGFEKGLPAGTGAWVSRLTTATGALAALALLPTAGKAAVVKVTNNPISLAFSAGDGANANWDVDGDGNIDFQLLNYFYDNSYKTMYLMSYSLQGRGFVGNYWWQDKVKGLADSFLVGPVLASNVWGRDNQYDRRIMSTSYGDIAIGPGVTSFVNGDNYFGFRFNKGGSMHYGYGIMNMDLSALSVTISKWAYQDVPDQSVHVEPFNSAPAVPGPIGLSVLAGGAAWTRKLRKRVKAAA
ncbi:MAG: hypothetical protein ACK5N0_15570 [Synechococcaceae cyanobacterium]